MKTHKNMTWWENMVLTLLKNEKRAPLIIATAFPGHRLGKVRKDAGIKKGGGKDGRAEDI